MSAGVPRIRNSAKAIIMRDGAILLQRCIFDGDIVHLLPGGTQEYEEALADTVRREVLEETGLRVAVERLLWVREFIVRNHLPGEATDGHVLECLFACRAEAGEEIAEATVPDAAQLDVRWVPIADLPAITLWPQTVQRLLVESGGDLTEYPTSYLGDCL